MNENGENYLLNQKKAINNLSDKSQFEKLELIRKLNIPIVHDSRVFSDNKIHFYPSVLLSNNPNLSTEEIKRKCEVLLTKEVSQFFNEPKYDEVKKRGYT